MTHPLQGSRGKIVRAQAHLAALKSEIQAYFDSRPYDLTTYKAANGHGYPDVVIRVEPPMILSAILGDCVCAIRAALDYILWELAKKYSVDTGISADERRVLESFPICNVPPLHDHLYQINRLAAQMPATAIAEIEAVQPYHLRYEPLWWLHELVNAAKHHMVPLTVGAGKSLFCVQVGPHRLFPDLGYDLATERGAANSDRTMQTHIPVYVAFEDPAMPAAAIDETLVKIIECVANVIARFERLF